MLSNACKYAIRAVIYLAVNTEKGKKIGIKKISNDLELPSPFLSKILQTLAKHKILYSTKGPNGGFGLAYDPKKLNLIDIVDLIDGKDIFNKCGIGINNCCEQNTHCLIHYKYARLRDEIKEIFQTTTLEEMIYEAENNGNIIFI